jgi:hypothetical protein
VGPLLASGSVSTLAAAPESGAGPDDSASTPSPPGSPRAGITGALVALCLSAALVAVAFVTSGSVDQTTATTGNTWTEIGLTLLGAGAVAAAVLGGGLKRGRAWGTASVGLMAALTALTALSILWSVVPDNSWSAANQMLSYLGAFAGAAALARLAPRRWPLLLGAVALATVAISAWALMAKVFPATLAPDNAVGRLQAPFGYWNAVGIVGALGLPACLWAGARRDRGRRLAGLAAPGITLALSAVVLSSSRSADAAAAVMIAAWMAFVPLRLRSAVVLAVGGAGAVVVSAWALSHSALTADGPLTPAMDSSGHTLGVVLLVVLVLVTAAGLACAWAMDHRAVPAATRRRAGTALVVLACLIPVAAVGALATSSRGLTGQITHAWDSLTSTHAVVFNNPGRVLEFGSSRPMYWHQGLDVGKHALFKGVGASGYGTARLRYTNNGYVSAQAHSYVIETFADLGLLGIAITFALLLAWVRAALRPIAPATREQALTEDQRDERAGMVALGLIVVGFGIESALDWTWYFPGVSVPVLLCAGWLAGRGPLTAPVGWLRSRVSLLNRPGTVAIAAAVAVVAVAGAWMQWQPQRSANQITAALNANSNAQAFADARAAASSDPLSYEPHFLLAQLYRSVNDEAAARAELVRATQIQPQNPITWLQLGNLQLQTGDLRQAIASMNRVGLLDRTPDSTVRTAVNVINHAQAAITQAKAAAAKRSATPVSSRRRSRGRAPASK